MKFLSYILIFLMIVPSAFSESPMIWDGDFAQSLAPNGFEHTSLRQIRDCGAVDPSSGAGIAAPEGSICQYDAGATGSLFIKSASLDTSWTNVLTANTGWGILGNTGTVAGTNFLGTTDSVDLVFKTNSTEYFRISADGTFDTTYGDGVIKSDAAGTLSSSKIVNNDVDAAAAIAYSKLNLTGSVLNSDLTDVSQSTIKGRAAGAGTGSPQDLTGTQATEILDNFVGDSGAGGTKGLAPAPAAGDAAAVKFLSADGTWSAVPATTDWSTTGNAGTVAGTNFVGTTDNIDFVAKRNGVEMLRLGVSGQALILNGTAGQPWRIYPTGSNIQFTNSVAANVGFGLDINNRFFTWDTIPTYMTIFGSAGSAGTDPTSPTAAGATPILEVRNSNTTVNNFSGVAFSNGQSGHPYDVGIFGIHENHSASGSQTGHYELVVSNAGVRSVRHEVSADGTHVMSAYGAGVAQFNSGGDIVSSTVANSSLADMAQDTIKGRASGAGTGAPQDLTATQATAILNNFVGDSGAGGTKGLVPAPAAGDTAAGKFLSSDGTWSAPAGGGGGSFSSSTCVLSGGNGHGSTNTMIRNFDTNTDSGALCTSALSATLGSSVTVNQDDSICTISYTDARGTSATDFGISINSTQLTTGIISITNWDDPTDAEGRVISTATPGSSVYANVSATIPCSSGDVLRPHTDSGPNVDSVTKFLVTVQVIQ